MFTCIKSLNRYNLTHNNRIIFSIFLYFKYSFLSNSFIYKFVRAIIFISYQLLICRVAKNLPVLQLLNHFIKSSTVAYKRVAYKKKSSVAGKYRDLKELVGSKKCSYIMFTKQIRLTMRN